MSDGILHFIPSEDCNCGHTATPEDGNLLRFHSESIPDKWLDKVPLFVRQSDFGGFSDVDWTPMTGRITGSDLNYSFNVLFLVGTRTYDHVA